MSISSFLLPALLVAATAATTESLTVMEGCQGSCGGVDIPYPFGISTGCFLKGFEITCINNGSSGDVPVLATTSPAIRVLNLSVAPPVARVMLPVAWQCFNSTGGFNGSFSGDVNINPESVYRISETMNELYVLGCNTLAYTRSGNRGRFRYMYYAGCVSYSNDSGGPRDGACAAIGCCHVDIPPGLTDNIMYFESGGYWSHANQEFCPCDYAFIVERGNYTFRASDLTSMPHDQTMPLLLDWAIRDNSSTSMWCAQAAKNKLDYACKSRHSECINAAIGPGYVCNCTQGYEGNPYVVDGCTNIKECTRPKEFPCHGICEDTEGSYNCRCSPGYESAGDPKEKPCNPKFSRSAKLALGVTMGTFGFVVILLVIWLTFKQKELKAIERKNGGNRLQHLKTLKFLTKKELDKITDNYSKYLGKGSFGVVYKGTLTDNITNTKTEVAVKSSIEVTNKDTQDDFVKEVEIQSSMIHRNILRLLGCCLEVNVPFLVYEYAANGNLEDMLHGKPDEPLCPLTLNSRLNIAIGSAEGLAYMHSYTTPVIQHGDVKPSNILLDGELEPKISDFGLSKFLKVGKQYATFVVGSLGYIDPVYQAKGTLTAKSDVYSFGVVLLELICRKPHIYGENGLIIEFKKVYEKDKSGRAIFDKEIAKEEDIPILEEIGILATNCLQEEVEKRPDMARVARELATLKDKLGMTNNSAWVSANHFAEP